MEILGAEEGGAVYFICQQYMSEQCCLSHLFTHCFCTIVTFIKQLWSSVWA